MKDYQRTTEYQFNYPTYETSHKLTVENLHLFGDYDGAKEKELVLNRLYLYNIPLYEEYASYEIAASDLVRNSIKRAISKEAYEITSSYERSKAYLDGCFPFGLDIKPVSINIEGSYNSAKNTVNSLQNDYLQIRYTQQFYDQLSRFIDDYSMGKVLSKTTLSPILEPSTPTEKIEQGQPGAK